MPTVDNFQGGFEEWKDIEQIIYTVILEGSKEGELVSINSIPGLFSIFSEKLPNVAIQNFDSLRAKIKRMCDEGILEEVSSGNFRGVPFDPNFSV